MKNFRKRLNKAAGMTIVVVGLLALLVIYLAIIVVFPIWYLIQIGHAPNWAVAMFIFILMLALFNSVSTDK